ncbi:polyprenyl synthetase family protein [Treponema socranskii]|uniref:polyprenyl synthetase family protein n=1 Tax=Treponema socranskii TaxID=53419 RepID=UPI003D900E8F
MDSVFSSRLARIETFLENALASDAAWKLASFGRLASGVRDTHIACLTEPCKSLIKLGGKRWRPLLLVLCAENARSFYGSRAILTEDETYSLAPLVEFVHTASLIHDDIEDSSDMRRGKPAAHITYGVDAALNAASWLYFEASVCIDCLAEVKAQLYALYANEVRRLHLGQAADILWHKNRELFPSIEEYSAMVQNKTGTLASLAAKIGTLAGGGTGEEIERAGKTAAEIGEAFQILDDVQNLKTGNPGKKRGDDIVEGKKSLPVLLHIEAHPEDKARIARFFAEAHDGGIDSPAVEACISLFEQSGAVEKAFEKGKTLVREKSAELAALYGASSETETPQLIIDLFASMIKKQEADYVREKVHA